MLPILVSELLHLNQYDISGMIYSTLKFKGKHACYKNNHCVTLQWEWYLVCLKKIHWTITHRNLLDPELKWSEKQKIQTWVVFHLGINICLAWGHREQLVKRNRTDSSWLKGGMIIRQQHHLREHGQKFRQLARGLTLLWNGPLRSSTSLSPLSPPSCHTLQPIVSSLTYSFPQTRLLHCYLSRASFTQVSNSDWL